MYLSKGARQMVIKGLESESPEEMRKWLTKAAAVATSEKMQERDTAMNRAMQSYRNNLSGSSD